MTPLILLGGGGHARVLLEALSLSGHVVLGVLDADPKKWGACLGKVPILGGDDKLLEYASAEIALVHGVGNTGLSPSRKPLFERCKAAGFRFESVVHPSAHCSTTMIRGEGVQIMAGAVVQTGALLGDGVIINTRAGVDHDCRLGSFVHVAPGATLCGQVEVGAGSFIGAGATIIQGVRIGEQCLVAAGAVVTRDLPARARVAGVPAKGHLP